MTRVIRVSGSAFEAVNNCPSYHFYKGDAGGIDGILGLFRHDLTAEETLVRMGQLPKVDLDQICEIYEKKGATSAQLEEHWGYVQQHAIPIIEELNLENVLTVEGECKRYPVRYRDPDTQSEHRRFNFAIPLPDPEDPGVTYLITGRDDLVIGNVPHGDIYDWKGLMRQHPFQGALYAYAAMRCWPRADIEGWTVRFRGIAREPWKWDEFHPTSSKRTLEAQLLDWCRAYKKLQDDGFWKPRTGDHCQYCRFAKDASCPAIRSTDIVPESAVIQTPVKQCPTSELLQANIWLKGKLKLANELDKAIYKELMERTKEEGAVSQARKTGLDQYELEIGERIGKAYQKTTGYERDEAKLRQALKLAGLRAPTTFNAPKAEEMLIEWIDSIGDNDLVGAKEKVQALLDEAITPNTTWCFTSRKAKGGAK